jgi:formate dehydrogenase beta subunit
MHKESNEMDRTNKINDVKETGMSRREFVGAVGAGIGTICILGTPGIVSAADDSGSPIKSILYDSTKCIACHTCEEACKKANNLSGEISEDSNLSADIFLKVTMKQLSQTEGVNEPIFLFNRSACRHCGSCAEVCPSGALAQREDGIVTVDSEKCIGCHYCHAACPFDIPRYGEDGTIRKCTFCASPVNNRLELGLEPACVSFCPTDALTFGDRDELLEVGRQRVQSLVEEGHDKAYLHGDLELGGLPVMYVLDDSIKEYGLPDLPLEVQTPVTLKDFGMPAGIIAGLAALAFGGMTYIRSRGEKAGREKTSEEK